MTLSPCEEVKVQFLFLNIQTDAITPSFTVSGWLLRLIREGAAKGFKLALPRPKLEELGRARGRNGGVNLGRGSHFV